MDWKTFVAGLLGVIIGTVGTGWFTYASKDEELKVHLVEIAMGILRADPSKEDVAPARAWAMDAIDKYSGLRPFTADERDALLHKPIGLGEFHSFLEMQKYFDAHPYPWKNGTQQ